MAKVTMLNMAGAEAGKIELNDAIFAITPNEYAVHEVVQNYLACQRQGTQSAKSRAEVRGGGRKPFRQKGTGRPKPREFRYTLPQKFRRLAMMSVLSSKVAEKEIIVLDELKFEAPKTKEMVKVLENIKAGKKALIVMAEKDDNVIKSAANIPGVRTALVNTMNVYEIVNHESFIVTQEAVKKIEEVYL